MSGASRLLDRARHDSVCVRAVRSIRRRSVDPLASAYHESAVDHVLTTVRSWVLASGLFRWFTTEPEPNVIVIDLSDSVVFGPVLGVLAGVVPELWSAISDSVVVKAIRRGAAAFDESPVRTFSLVVLAFVVVHTATSALVESLLSTELLLRGFVFALALAGTRVR